MSNNSKISELKGNIDQTVRINCLDRLNPLFALNPTSEKLKSSIHINYKDSNEMIDFPENLYSPEEDRVKMHSLPSDRDMYGQAKPYFWVVIPNEQFAIRIEDKYEIINRKFFQYSTNVPEIKLYNSSQLPIFIKTFSDSAKKTFKKSLLLISEMLPYNPFSIWIYTNFKTKKQYKEVLNMIAKYAVRNDAEDIIDKLRDIIEDNKKSFYRKLDEVFNLNSEIDHPPEYSYCLCCGERINSNSKFCDSTISSKSYSVDRDNCLHKFKHWIKSRLGISDQKKSRELRDQYYNEMQILVEKYRFSAFEIFQENNPKLFEKRKRGRKPKIK